MSDKAPHQSLRPPRACAVCGAEFRSEWPTKKYCSPMCRMKATEARRKRPAPPKEGDPGE